MTPPPQRQYETSSLSDGVAVVTGDLGADLARVPLVDLRQSRVRLTHSPDGPPPRLLLQTTDAEAAASFWTEALGYEHQGPLLLDPLRRCPAIRVEQVAEVPVREQRLHLDVSRLNGASESAVPTGGRFVGGPYGVCFADSEGNLVDAVPAGPLADTPGTEDWVAGFAAMAAYHYDSFEQAWALVREAATAADQARFPLAIDLRPDWVVFDSGKDLWEEVPGFVELAGRLQSLARSHGLAPDPSAVRFVQLFFDVPDVAAASTEWIERLGYVPDQRDGVTDIVDPTGLGPVLVFQESDPAGSGQGNGFVVEVA